MTDRPDFVMLLIDWLNMHFPKYAEWHEAHGYVMPTAGVSNEANEVLIVARGENKITVWRNWGDYISPDAAVPILDAADPEFFPMLEAQLRTYGLS